jgi:uncharacterized protein
VTDLHVAVIADTHMRRSWKRTLPPAVVQLCRDADLILHAGDVIDAHVLDELRTYAPLHAVLGNNDRELVGVLPETLELDLAGVAVAMIHDSGPAKGRTERLTARFPDADVIVFGHSHIPWLEWVPDGPLLLNPGSPTERRRQPHRTAAVLALSEGEVADVRIEVVDP